MSLIELELLNISDEQKEKDLKAASKFQNEK